MSNNETNDPKNLEENEDSSSSSSSSSAAAGSGTQATTSINSLFPRATVGELWVLRGDDDIGGDWYGGPIKIEKVNNNGDLTVRLLAHKRRGEEVVIKKNQWRWLETAKQNEYNASLRREGIQQRHENRQKSFFNKVKNLFTKKGGKRKIHKAKKSKRMTRRR